MQVKRVEQFRKTFEAPGIFEAEGVCSEEKAYSQNHTVSWRRMQHRLVENAAIRQRGFRADLQLNDE
jgi:hypothetical protein